ncbi:putative retrieval of early ER protein Rer1 [Helianthus anomalus]
MLNHTFAKFDQRIHITTTTATPTTDVDAATSSGALHSTDTPAAAVQRWAFVISQRYQHLLDKSTPFLLYRWIVFCVIAIIYTVRVLHLQGLYAVSYALGGIYSYALGIYILNLLIRFLSPQVDPEFQDLSDGPFLPNRSSDEFRPFVRRLPEFKFCSSRGLTDPLTEDESMSHSSSRGWPSSAYFIQGYILGAGKSYYAATLLGLIAHMSFFPACGGGQYDPSLDASVGSRGRARRGKAQLKCLKHTQVLKMLCTSLTNPFIFVTCSCPLWAEGFSLQVMAFGCLICRNGLKVQSWQ